MQYLPILARHTHTHQLSLFWWYICMQSHFYPTCHHHFSYYGSFGVVFFLAIEATMCTLQVDFQFDS